MTRRGATLRRVAARVCDEQTMARVIDPAIADLQFEQDAATGPRRRRAALVGGYVGYWKALSWCACRAIVLSPVRWAREDDGAMARTVALACVLGAVVTIGMTLPPLVSERQTSLLYTGVLFATLVPQAMIFGLHVGVTFGVLVALRGRPLTRRLLRSTLALALGASCVGIVITGWLVPAGNQAFRVLALRQITSSSAWTGGAVNIPRGPNETPLFEAAASPNPAVRRSFHVRTSLAIGTGVLTLFALGLSSVIRRRRVAVLAGVALPIAYLATVWGVEFVTGTEGLSGPMLWLAHILLSLMAVMFVRRMYLRTAPALAN